MGFRFRLLVVSQKFIIVGGGIGGLAAAVALRRAGCDVEVFERAPAFREVGAGVSLWPNATRVLRAWGVLGRVLARGAEVTRFDLRRAEGARLASIAMDGFDTPALCVHRAELHAALLAELPEACLKTDHTLESFAPAGSGVIARFSGGREARADGLIGADGIHSVVRAQLHGAAAPIFHGYSIWRGLAPALEGIARGPISETWGRGQRFGIMPIGPDRICWYATRNARAAQADAPGGRKREVQDLFAGWHAPIGALVAATREEDILRNDARDRPALRRWGRGCITLLGDAAHPLTPNVGQGACLAIEDAACLAKALAGTADVVAAFRAYEARRNSRTAFVARQARRVGVIGQWENAWLVRGRNLIAKLVLAGAPPARLNPVYAYEV
jgi:2-polyprenyl-6-methoxyphenol hydroxylase-like FAD-dependent oxidoreductase